MAASLSVSKAEAESILGEHQVDGEALLTEAQTRMTAEVAYDDWRRRRRKWVELTKEGLTYVYASDKEAEEFETAANRSVFFGPSPWFQNLEFDLQVTNSGVDKLASLISRLRYASEPGASTASVATPLESERSTTSAPEIFLVHGRNRDKRDSVARFLERTGPSGIRPTILDEQAGKGRTIVEKLEQHAGDATYAVVLLTADDQGGLAGTEERLPRARQNVILELGLFSGLLGRDKVAVLYESGVEIPSDIGGLEYIPLNGDWEKRLVQELRAAGWDFSLDRLAS